MQLLPIRCVLNIVFIKENNFPSFETKTFPYFLLLIEFYGGSIATGHFPNELRKMAGIDFLLRFLNETANYIWINDEKVKKWTICHFFTYSCISFVGFLLQIIVLFWQPARNWCMGVTHFNNARLIISKGEANIFPRIYGVSVQMKHSQNWLLL